MERLYFQTWNVGNICGSNKAPGCRQAAIDYLTSGVPSIGYQPGEGQIMVTMGLLDDDGQAVDLTQYGKLQSLNYSSISGVCNGMNPLSVTVQNAYQVSNKATGCLGGPAPTPFVVAVIKPPPASGMFGGQLKGCPNGFCLVALNAPDGASITDGSDKVAKVCGDIRHVCTVAVGDFNLSPQHTYQERWAQLIGSPKSGPQKLVTDGQDHARWVTNMAAGGSMDIQQQVQKYLGNGSYQNVTGIRTSLISDALLPCQHPGTWSNDGCTV